MGIKKSQLDLEIAQALDQSARQGWLWGGLEQLAHRGLALVVNVILARLLAPEAFGLIASVSIFVAIAQQLIDGGIIARMLQKKDIGEDDYTAFFWCNGSVSVLAAGLLGYFSSHIAEFYGNPELRPVILMMAVVIVLLNAGRVQECRLIRDFRFKLISLITVGAVLAGSIVGIAIALGGGGVWAILGQQFTMALVRAVTFWILVPWRPSKRPIWATIKDLYTFGTPLMIAQTVRSATEQLINVLTARYIGMAALGFYDRGRFIPSSLSQVAQRVFFRTTLPLLAVVQNDKEEFRCVYLKLVNKVMVVCLFSATGVFLCAPEIIEVLLGAKWLPSLWFFRAGSVLSLVNLMFLLNVDVLKSKGFVSEVFKMNIVYAVFEGVGVIIGFSGGVRGMVLGAMGASVLALFLLMRAVSKAGAITISDQYRALREPILCAFIATPILWSVRQLSAEASIRFGLCGTAMLIMAAVYVHVKKYSNPRREVAKS
jgi:teichuronic acid exporter